MNEVDKILILMEDYVNDVYKSIETVNQDEVIHRKSLTRRYVYLSARRLRDA